MTKYELIPDDVAVGLFRVKALKDFGNVRAGDIGGIVTGEHNLSQDGDCWLDHTSKAVEQSRIRHDAQVRNSSLLYGAVVKHNTVIRNSTLSGACRVLNRASVNNCTIQGQAVIRDNASLSDCTVLEEVSIKGYVQINAAIKIEGTSRISNRHDIVWFGNVGTEFGTLVATRDKKMGVRFSRGCFSGPAQAFIAQSMRVHDSTTHREYMLLLQMAYLRILGKELKIQKLRRKIRREFYADSCR